MSSEVGERGGKKDRGCLWERSGRSAYALKRGGRTDASEGKAVIWLKDCSDGQKGGQRKQKTTSAEHSKAQRSTQRGKKGEEHQIKRGEQSIQSLAVQDFRVEAVRRGGGRDEGRFPGDTTVRAAGKKTKEGRDWKGTARKILGRISAGGQVRLNGRKNAGKKKNCI